MSGTKLQHATHVSLFNIIFTVYNGVNDSLQTCNDSAQDPILMGVSPGLFDPTVGDLEPLYPASLGSSSSLSFLV